MSRFFVGVDAATVGGEPATVFTISDTMVEIAIPPEPGNGGPVFDIVLSATFPESMAGGMEDPLSALLLTAVRYQHPPTVAFAFGNDAVAFLACQRRTNQLGQHILGEIRVQPKLFCLRAAHVQHETEPQLMRQSWCDKATALLTAQAITSALLARERGAGGQHLHVSMLDAALSFLWPDGLEELTLADADPDRLPAPLADAFKPIEAADGLVTVTAVGEDQMTRLLIALGEEEYLLDPRFATAEKLAENAGQAVEIFREALAGKTLAEWTERFQTLRGQWAPVQNSLEVGSDPQARAMGYLAASETADGTPFELPASPVQFDEQPTPTRRSPDFNEHGDEILEEIGLDMEAIIALRMTGAVT